MPWGRSALVPFLIRLQQGEDVVDVRLGMVGVDLSPDFLVTAGHDRVCESGNKDSVVVEILHKISGPLSVPNHEGDHRVFSRNRLDADATQSILETLRERAEVLEKP